MRHWWASLGHFASLSPLTKKIRYIHIYRLIHWIVLNPYDCRQNKDKRRRQIANWKSWKDIEKLSPIICANTQLIKTLVLWLMFNHWSEARTRLAGRYNYCIVLLVQVFSPPREWAWLSRNPKSITLTCLHWNKVHSFHNLIHLCKCLIINSVKFFLTALINEMVFPFNIDSSSIINSVCRGLIKEY